MLYYIMLYYVICPKPFIGTDVKPNISNLLNSEKRIRTNYF